MEQISTIGLDIAKNVFQVHGIDENVDRHVRAWHRSNKTSTRLEAIPGVGPLVATALVASVPDPTVFRSGRDLSAWIGLVPKQNSTGGKNRLGSISKAGNRYLRQLLVVGALSVIRRAKQLGYLSPHSARHGFATGLLRAGIDPVTVAALGRWKSRRAFVDFYCHEIEDKSLVERLLDSDCAPESTPVAAKDLKDKAV